MTQTAKARVAHSESGTGAPALLFIPGWCGDRTVFDALVERTSTARRAIAIDLPEQGESPRTGNDFGAADVATEAIALLDRLDVEHVVPVGVAHAGWTAIELRRQLGPARVPAVVLLDWMVLGPPPGFLEALHGLQNERAWEQVRAGLFAMWTTGVDVPVLHEYVARMGTYGEQYWSRAGREIAASFTRYGTPLAALEQLGAEQGASCPTLHAYAQPADEAVLAAQQAYVADHPWFEVHRLDARSHFPMFEVPGEISGVIESFVDRAAGR
jgi:pimeloyl-ACP methyl ester carboxylesterase